MVQHKVVVWLYFALELSVPAVLYSALSYDASLTSILVRNNFKYTVGGRGGGGGLGGGVKN